MIRKILVLLVVMFLASLAFGCGSKIWSASFQDLKGRTCTYRCSGDTCSMDCSVSPNPTVCTARPCYVLGPVVDSAAPDGHDLALCDGCCSEDGSSAGFLPEDCSAIVCSTSDNCPLAGFVCSSERCRHPA
jgi:hypothetical protein